MRSVIAKTWRLFVLVCLVAAISAASFVAGYGAHWFSALQDGLPWVSPEPLPSEDEAFRTFWQGWRLLERDYYGEVPDIVKAARAALKGVVQELGDPYTVVVDPEYSAILREDMSGSFEGIGAVVRINEAGYLEIVEAFEEQPAHQAGLRRGDIILKVDDTAIEGMNVFEAVALIRGPEGTSVRLLVRRPGVGSEPFEVTVIRRKIEIPSVQPRLLEQASGDRTYLIGYIGLTDFNAAVPRAFSAALQALLTRDPDGLILDLRGNPGGYLHVAVDVASQFVGQGTIVIERYKGGEEQHLLASPGGLATDPRLPLVVLVDIASASASEIVAGAVQDTGRGVLVGEKTFGKGSVQLSYVLADGSEFRVTTARWFTPKGREIQGEGLEPDVLVPASEGDGGAAGVDVQLEAAIAQLIALAENGQ
ncbi:MAG: S41 family peptidase [Anaerolineae bacterium]